MSDIDSHLPELVATGGPNVARSSDLPASSLHWMVTELEACFVVIDSIGQKIAFVYFAPKSNGGQIISYSAKMKHGASRRT